MRAFDPTVPTLATPSNARTLALRSVALRIAHLAREAKGAAAERDALVARVAPTARQQFGPGTQLTAAVLVAVGENIDRCRTEAAFAHLCATATRPVSSGSAMRHRLNHAGHRGTNRAPLISVTVRPSDCPRTRACMAQRIAEGRTRREAIRCLKRSLLRDVFQTLRADLSTLPDRL